MNYVKERDPDIQLIVQGAPGDQAILRYRCKLCKTNGQPQGKVNLLGTPVMQRVRWLLERHIGSDYHVGRKARREGGPDGDAENPTVKVDCSGFLSLDE